jgi:hypothetical protein
MLAAGVNGDSQAGSTLSTRAWYIWSLAAGRPTQTALLCLRTPPWLPGVRRQVASALPAAPAKPASSTTKPPATAAAPKSSAELSEKRRREICADCVRANDRAVAEADKKYPGFGRQNTEEAARLTKQYVRDVARRHGITSEKAWEIFNEGMKKNWPFPPRQ